ncbi:hypothetical protein [Planctobacterium marinum]|uniref:hypothetical protein n=1 Tax=Planctobacterium marinum TaxID=1631968 RepID=UPI001E38B3E8|nr:hypothetical protein [Planctobacterium marinum]MCC2606150.1 hypothetical protein [Planctobacterium marinum]
MNSILRKTLIAAAVAGTFGANAATITSVDNGAAAGIQQVISSQGLVANAGEIVVGNTPNSADSNELRVGWTPSVAYNDNDVLVFTFSGATIDTTATTVSTVGLENAAGATRVGAGLTSVIDVTSTSVTISVDADNVLAGSTAYYLTGITLDVTDTAAGSISVASSAQRGNANFDTGAATTIASVASQWTLGATGDTDLNGVIDVTNSRYSFSANSDGDATLDEFDITVTTGTHLMTTTATAVTSVVTTSGSFDWTLDSDGDFDTATVDNTVAAGSATATESLNDDMDELTLTLSGDADNGISTWQFDVPGDVALTESIYNAETTVSYSFDVDGAGAEPATPGTLNLGSSSIGAWTLGGTSAFIEFMPYGSGLTQFIYVANTSSVDAGIELSAISDSGETANCGELSVSAAGNAVTSIGGAVLTALESCGLGNSGDRLALTLTINADSAAIDVTAGYNSRGDRVLID